MLDTITLSQFQECLDDTFTIRFEENVRLEATLSKVEKRGGDSEKQDRPFSIILKTQQKGEYYNQGIFMVSHPNLGDLSLFLTPIGPNEDGMQYEAIFG